MMLDKNKIEQLKKGVDRRLTIDGETKPYQAYYVPLDGLFFNDVNGRISTYIEENDNSKDPHKNLKLLLENNQIDEYNNLIAEFIKESANDGGASFKKTKEDIKQNGQKIPGVILRNGRIIDGNRRFTCLRELYKETGDTKFAFFECVILDVPQTKEQIRSIKLLELNIQFNVDEKRDYNRIDFLVSFYKDTMDDKSADVIDKKTYCYASGIKEAAYNENKTIVETMLDYLEWRNKPKAFYILKNEKLDGPIEDIAKKRKKWTKDEWDSRKTTVYAYMTFNATGDRTRDIRKILESASRGGQLYENLKSQIENPDTLLKITDGIELLEKKPTTPEESKEKLQTLTSIQNEMVSTFKEGSFAESMQNDANAPLKSLESSIKYLKSVNTLQVEQFSGEKKEEIRKKAGEAEALLNSIKDACK